MNRTASVLVLMFAASAMWAQTVNPSQVLGSARNAAAKASAASTGAKNGSNPSSNTTSASGSSAQAKPAVHASTEPLGEAAKKVAKPISMGNSKPVTKAAPKKPAATTPKASPAAESASASPSVAPVKNKRDPFVSPIVNRTTGPAGCSGGKKCLVVDQVALKGIVKAPNGMIAVIVNPGNKAYFMRENDPVWNGFVVKITLDSIIFRETVVDRVGRSSTREVVKKVTTPAV